MTTDKTPTDAAILDVWASFVGDPTPKLPLTDADKVEFARAVLAKWGSPVVAGEPEGWVTWWPKLGGGRDPIYSHGPKKPGHGAELDAVLRKYPVFAAPQPTQAQAGAVDDTALIESQSREIAALKEQEAQLCTLYGLAQAECKRLRKDAERYAWLRHGDNDELVLCHGPVAKDYWYLPRNEKLDAAIDAAMVKDAVIAAKGENKP